MKDQTSLVESKQVQACIVQKASDVRLAWYLFTSGHCILTFANLQKLVRCKLEVFNLEELMRETCWLHASHTQSHFVIDILQCTIAKWQGSPSHRPLGTLPCAFERGIPASIPHEICPALAIRPNQLMAYWSCQGFRTPDCTTPIPPPEPQWTAKNK